MKTKITLHFYAKSTKANSNGLLPIYVRLTVDGKRLEFSTKKFVEKSKWSSELAKMKGTTEEARSISYQWCTNRKCKQNTWTQKFKNYATLCKIIG